MSEDEMKFEIVRLDIVLRLIVNASIIQLTVTNLNAFITGRYAKGFVIANLVALFTGFPYAILACIRPTGFIMQCVKCQMTEFSFGSKMRMYLVSMLTGYGYIARVVRYELFRGFDDDDDKTELIYGINPSQSQGIDPGDDSRNQLHSLPVG